MSRSESDAAVALISKVTEGKTLLMVEHDMSVVFAFATRVMVLVAGKLLVDAAPDIVRKDARVKEAYFGEDI